MDAPEMIAAEPESPAPTAGAAASARSAQRFDFRHPAFLSSAEWRKLRMEVEEFVESTGALLSTYLRLDFGLQLDKLQTIAFGDWTAALPATTHLVLFKTDPLRGICLAEIGSKVAQAVVDRLLGGPGKSLVEERLLTEMESALLDQFVQLILDEWCKQWTKLQRLDSQILGHENNPKFLQCARADTIMLIATLQVRLGESEGHIQLAFPYAALEPLVNKLAQLGAESVPATPPAVPTAPKWTKHLDKVPVTLQAQWPTMKLTTRALLSLQVGSVLDLKPDDVECLELRLGNVTKFRGRLGTRDQKWAVQITEVSKL